MTVEGVDSQHKYKFEAHSVLQVRPPRAKRHQKEIPIGDTQKLRCTFSLLCINPNANSVRSCIPARCARMGRERPQPGTALSFQVSIIHYIGSATVQQLIPDGLETEVRTPIADSAVSQRTLELTSWDISSN